MQRVRIMKTMIVIAKRTAVTEIQLLKVKMTQQKSRIRVKAMKNG